MQARRRHEDRDGDLTVRHADLCVSANAMTVLQCICLPPQSPTALGCMARFYLPQGALMHIKPVASTAAYACSTCYKVPATALTALT